MQTEKTQRVEHNETFTSISFRNETFFFICCFRLVFVKHLEVMAYHWHASSQSSTQGVCLVVQQWNKPLWDKGRRALKRPTFVLVDGPRFGRSTQNLIYLKIFEVVQPLSLPIVHQPLRRHLLMSNDNNGILPLESHLKFIHLIQPSIPPSVFGTCNSSLSSPMIAAFLQSMTSENGSSQPLLRITGIQAACWERKRSGRRRNLPLWRLCLNKWRSAGNL